MKTNVEWTELSPVVSRGDLDDARAAARADSGGGGAFDGLEVQAVDDELVDALDVDREGRIDQPPEAGGERRVGAGAELLVLAADLRARPCDPAGERQDH